MHQSTQRTSLRELDEIFSSTASEVQRHELYSIADRLSSEEFPAALTALRRTVKDKDSELYHDLAAFWFERDLSAAKAWLTALPPEERAKVFTAVVKTWAAIDITDVFNWIRSLPEEQATSLASANCHDLACLLSKSDPAAAVDFLIATPHPWLDRGGEEEVFTEWGKRDPHAASKRINDLDVDHRMEAAIGLINGWVEQSPKDVEAWISTLDDAPILREAIKSYISARSERNPEAAAAYMLEHWIPQIQEDGFMTTVVTRWAEKDEAAALSWIKALKDDDMREKAMYDLLTTIDSNNPEHGAQLWLSEFGEAANDRGWWEWNAATDIASSLATEIGLSAAFDFLAKVSQRDRGFIIDEFIGGQVRNAGAMDIAEAVLREPAGSIRSEMIGPVFKRLADEGQASEASQLLENISTVPERLVAIKGLVEGELERNPDRAFQLAQSLCGATDGRRIALEELSRTYKQWKGELKEWLQKTQLITPEEKAQVLKQSQSGSR